MKSILLIMTGATMAQKVGPDGRMRIDLNAFELLKDVNTRCQIDVIDLQRRTGAELSFDTIAKVHTQVQTSDPKYDGFVLITGTDSMEEMAFILDLTLPTQKPFIITGAMKPADLHGFDGRANLEQAFLVACSDQAAHLGPLVVINDSIHPARYVRKQDSQLIGAFRSHPGPIGQIRRGRPYFYYTALTRAHPFTDVNWSMIDPRVLVIPICVETYIPEALLNQLSGLVLAGMGTGSISQSLMNQLQPWTQKLPIVLSSRCPEGVSFDEHTYRGSRIKYEKLGFILEPYGEMNPIQARNYLILSNATQLDSTPVAPT